MAEAEGFVEPLIAGAFALATFKAFEKTFEEKKKELKKAEEEKKEADLKKFKGAFDVGKIKDVLKFPPKPEGL